MARNKKAKEEKFTLFSDDEIAAMTDLQKLMRIRYFESEICSTKCHLKAQKDAAKDYIEELDAKRLQLIATVPAEVFAGCSNMQAAIDAGVAVNTSYEADSEE